MTRKELKLDREEAELIIRDRARFTLPEHAEFVSTAGMCYSDDAVRAALALLDQAPPTPSGDMLAEQFQNGFRAGKLAEREANAQIADAIEEANERGSVPRSIAAAIRSRTPKEPNK